MVFYVQFGTSSGIYEIFEREGKNCSQDEVEVDLVWQFCYVRLNGIIDSFLHVVHLR